MRVYDVEQGSQEWHDARLAIPTASQFHRILTPTLKPSNSARKYAYELLAETFIGENQQPDLWDNEYVVRGTNLEDDAVAWYELQRDVTCTEVGFVTTDDGKVGCSPDRFVGEDGGLEIKCPNGATHIGYLLGEDAHKHRCQVQGSLWVTGRKWWDLLIYSPFLRPSLTRYTPDPVWVERWEELIPKFLADLEEAKAQLEAMGMDPVEAKKPEPLSWGDIFEDIVERVS